jgi:uncharacterized protein YqgV (UPF0045/DUF77 family)
MLVVAKLYLRWHAFCISDATSISFYKALHINTSSTHHSNQMLQRKRSGLGIGVGVSTREMEVPRYLDIVAKKFHESFMICIRTHRNANGIEGKIEACLEVLAKLKESAIRFCARVADLYRQMRRDERLRIIAE